jgi:hypothetical protein
MTKAADGKENYSGVRYDKKRLKDTESVEAQAVLEKLLTQAG